MVVDHWSLEYKKSDVSRLDFGAAPWRQFFYAERNPYRVYIRKGVEGCDELYQFKSHHKVTYHIIGLANCTISVTRLHLIHSCTDLVS